MVERCCIWKADDVLQKKEKKSVNSLRTILHVLVQKWEISCYIFKVCSKCLLPIMNLTAAKNMKPVKEKVKKDKMLSIAAISAVHKFQYLLFAKCYLKIAFERKKPIFKLRQGKHCLPRYFFLQHFLRASSSVHFLRAAIVVFS